MTKISLRPQSIRNYIWKVLLLCLVTASAAFVPFIIKGNGIFVLLNDFSTQQVPLCIGANDAIKSGDVFWNWSIDLGSNFIGVLSFYNLGTPFFWLTLLFPAKAFPYLAGWIYILKYCIAGLTAFLYLKRFVKNLDFAVLGALLYAFSGFQTINLMFYNFHDVVAFFPLMLVGLESLVEGRMFGLFSLAVGINVLNNFFFFVGEAVFIILYFIFRWLIPDFKKAIKRIPQCLLEAVLGIGLAAFILLPSVLLTLDNPRIAVRMTGHDLMVYQTDRYITLLKSVFIPADVMAETKDYTSSSAYLPFIGIGLTIGYVLSKPKKWLSLLIIVCLLFAGIPVLNSLFYGLNGNYYARWFYMLVLMFILAAVVSLDNIPEHRKGAGVGFAAAIIGSGGFLLALFRADLHKRPTVWGPSVQTFAVYASIALAGVIAAAVLYYTVKDSKKLAALLIAGIMVFSAATTIINIAKQQDDSQDAQYIYNVQTSGSQLLELPDVDQYRFRIDWKYDNTAVVNHTMTVNSFITTLNGSIFEFYENIGCPRRIVTLCEDSLIDTLLSVKYKVFTEPQESKDTVLTYSDGSRTLYVYEKSDVLPIGFTYDYYITKGKFLSLPMEIRPYVLLNAVVVDTASAVDDRLNPLPNSYYESMESIDITGAIAKRKQESGTNFKRDSKGFSVDIRTENDTYAYFSVPYDKGWSASVNGSEVSTINSSGMMVIPLNAGDNDIRFDYHTPGLTSGLIITVCSALILALYWMLARRRIKDSTL